VVLSAQTHTRRAAAFKVAHQGCSAAAGRRQPPFRKAAMTEVLKVLEDAIGEVRMRAMEEREEFKDPIKAGALEWAAKRFEAALERYLGQRVNYAGAAAHSHYSVSSLEKMKAAGKLNCEETADGPRFLVRDLPVKPGSWRAKNAGGLPRMGGSAPASAPSKHMKVRKVKK